jgi:hypothetical protein
VFFSASEARQITDRLINSSHADSCNKSAPAFRATRCAALRGRVPPMHHADKFNPALPMGSRLNAKMGSQLEAIPMLVVVVVVMAAVKEW